MGDDVEGKEEEATVLTHFLFLEDYDVEAALGTVVDVGSALFLHCLHLFLHP